MSPSPTTRAIQALRLPDISYMLPLNNTHTAETSLLDEASLAALLSMAFYARGIDRGATALLIALEHTACYTNPNFNWFKTHRESFIYVDRVIISSAARGQGLGRALYRDLFAAAKQAGHDRVVCEVNIDPPNPTSEAFHAAMGFIGIGQATIHSGTRTVCYLERALR
jgi:uncharacterized protein